MVSSVTTGFSFSILERRLDIWRTLSSPGGKVLVRRRLNDQIPVLLWESHATLDTVSASCHTLSHISGEESKVYKGKEVHVRNHLGAEWDDLLLVGGWSAMLLKQRLCVDSVGSMIPVRGPGYRGEPRSRERGAAGRVQA